MWKNKSMRRERTLKDARIVMTMLAMTAVSQAAGTASNSAHGRLVLDLSGPGWQMEGIRPGQGLKEGFHESFGEVCPSTYNWNGATVPGDVYTDLWRAGEIDDPQYGRNALRAKWAMEKEWWYRRRFYVVRDYPLGGLRQGWPDLQAKGDCS